MIGLRGEPSGSPRFAFRGPHTGLDISGSKDLGSRKRAWAGTLPSIFVPYPIPVTLLCSYLGCWCIGFRGINAGLGAGSLGFVGALLCARTRFFLSSIRVGSTERCFQSNGLVNVLLCNCVRSIKSHAVAPSMNQSNGFHSSLG